MSLLDTDDTDARICQNGNCGIGADGPRAPAGPGPAGWKHAPRDSFDG